MKLLNERRVIAHRKIGYRIAKQLARMVRKTTLTDLYARTANYLAEVIRN